jgi:hypothetical protein
LIFFWGGKAWNFWDIFYLTTWNIPPPTYFFGLLKNVGGVFRIPHFSPETIWHTMTHPFILNIHTYIYTYIFTHIHIFIHLYIYIHIHIHELIYILGYEYTYRQACEYCIKKWICQTIFRTWHLTLNLTTPRDHYKPEFLN